MSGSSAKPKQTSRWGSLLSGAVANLESRLDTFFEEDSKNTRKENGHPISSSTATLVRTTTEPGTSRSSEPTPGGAISDQNLDLYQKEATEGSLRQDESTPGAQSLEKDVKSSIERKSSDSIRPATALAPTDEGAPGSIPENVDNANSTEDIPSLSTLHHSQPSLAASLEKDDTFTEDEHQTRLSDEGDLALGSQSNPTPKAGIEDNGDDLKDGEETTVYLERIDALETKLEFLAKQAAESAHHIAVDKNSGEAQKKLAVKDEQIALLIEEGQKLSKAEVSSLGLIRRLKMRIAEESKSHSITRQQLVAAEKRCKELVERTRKFENNLKELNQKGIIVTRLEREIQTIKASRDEQRSTAEYLRLQLDNESKSNNEAKIKEAEIALEQQRKLNGSLQEDLDNYRIEQQLKEDRYQTEIKTLSEKLTKEGDSKKTAEFQMRNEIQVLENRLEAIRTRTEEASSNSGNDLQAKLLRQIETLQSQYAVASENWQTLETSLQARIAALERERDDVVRAETEARKRAREFGTTSRRLQDQLDETSRKCSVFEQELQERHTYVLKIEAQAQQLESRLGEANSRLERERLSWEASLASRIEEEKSKWRNRLSAVSSSETNHTTLDMPSIASRKVLTADPSIAASRKGAAARQFSSELSIPSQNEKDPKRRNSSKIHRSSELMSPGINEFGPSTPIFDGTMPETPSIHTVDAEDMFDNDSSPRRTVNDMISVSTVGTGPSLQLVERMSSAVRRLESEKAATRDELSRLALQRDEARNEVVALMKEVEEKRSLDSKLSELEQNKLKAEGRLQTTLEMLGEKTERVEELEADVADLKKIYRELVQTIQG